MLTKHRLLETLNELSSEELEEFMQQIYLEKGFPLAPKKQLKPKNAQDIVELMVKTYDQECVELTRKVLQMMNRKDLVLNLLGIKGKTIC